MKSSVAIIGRGKWGNLLKKKLQNISNVKIFIGKKYRTLNYDNIDWVFIATPDSTHYQVIKFFLSKNLNIFCEKPIVRNLKIARIIFNKSKNRKKNIYVSDLLTFVKKKIHLKKQNEIFRSKKAKFNIKEALYRLAYHDFYYLYKYLNKNNNIIEKKFQNKKLIINISNKFKKFRFIYNFNMNKKIHTYNSIDIIKDEDPLEKMLLDVLKGKVKYKINQARCLFALQLIEKILKK